MLAEASVQSLNREHGPRGLRTDYSTFMTRYGHVHLTTSKKASLSDWLRPRQWKILIAYKFYRWYSGKAAFLVKF